MNATRSFGNLLLACSALVFTAPAAAALPPAQTALIVVERGTHKLVREASAIERVAIGDPAIADVSLINRRELLLTGKTPGITSLTLWPEGQGRPRQISIKVAAAVDPARAARSDTELARAQIEPGRSLEGVLPNLLAHRRARIAAAEGAKEAISDSSAVTIETQVMTEVKIVEISRSTLQQFGFNLLKSTANTAAGQFSPGSLSGTTMNQNPSRNGVEFISSLPLQNAFNLVVGNPNKGLLGILSVLERKGMARVLAEPTLLATSGQTANYLAGGEFPVPVAQGGAAAGSITVDYKEFGVRLSISPTVLSRDRIALKVAPEVSDLDFSAGIQIGGVAVPALTVRRTDTSIELGDGESFIISGLVSSNLLNNVSKVPWLGDLPVIGAFFRSTSFDRQEKELVMIVTPHLVRPLAKNAQLPKLPGSDYENYDPSFAGTMLIESGEFTTGFSR